MNYVYDILLNLSNNKRVYDFYEWNQNDDIVNVKKVPVIRVDSKTLLDIFNYKVKISSSFLGKLENNFSIYKNTRKKIKYLVVLSDCNKAFGISINSKGIIESKSSLLLDEEEEVLFIAEKEKIEKIDYKKIRHEEKEKFLTRKEEEEKDFLLKEINTLYKNNDIEKLKYLYIEYYNIKEENIDNIYTKLINSLESIDEKHEELYQLLKLTCKK